MYLIQYTKVPHLIVQYEWSTSCIESSVCLKRLCSENSSDLALSSSLSISSLSSTDTLWLTHWQQNKSHWMSSSMFIYIQLTDLENSAMLSSYILHGQNIYMHIVQYMQMFNETLTGI